MTAWGFGDWLTYGIERGWVSDIVCDTHDGIPLTDEEEDQWEEGGDPCAPVVRVWGEDGSPEPWVPAGSPFTPVTPTEAPPQVARDLTP